ncbi:hypothetical protein [Horticoccus sp. 23ND18S-11]|uniref:hypothetical protein n=1 Tax=Horticoccus sp. 23ND18S-11 TaxID=3391832 RepID=UPI0039C9BFE3
MGREVSSAECGENRLSRYACPECCEHNPFRLAAYSHLLETEDRLDLATVKRLAAEDAVAREAMLAAARSNRDLGLHAVSAWQIFFRRDAGGRTFAERWEQAGFAGLRNDDRVLFRGKMKLRVALVEVHRVIDAERLEVVDLLRPDDAPFIVVDRSLAARAPRFFVGLGWVYPLAYFWRLSGSALELTDLGPGTWRENIEAIVAHLGGPVGGPAQASWLAENFVRMCEAIIATAQERRRLMFAGIDGAWGAATYTLQMPLAKALRLLEKESAVQPEEVTPEQRQQGFVGVFVWFDDRPEARTLGNTGQSHSVVLGRVLVGAREWRLEAMGRARLQDFRARFEARMGKAVTFSRERIDDLTGRMALAEPTPNLALVPPQLLEEPRKLEVSTSQVPLPPPGMSAADFQAGMKQAIQRAWKDEPVPALGGRTPREAARNPATRAQVIEWVKQRVREIDSENLRTGGCEDANELIRDLGLTEIDFPPPPSRQRPPEDDAAASESMDDDFDDFRPEPAGVARRLPAPRLMGPPLTQEEAIARVEAALQQFDHAADALGEIVASGSDIVDDLQAMTEEMFAAGEFEMLVPPLIEAWFALVPPGVRAPALNRDRLADEIDALNARFAVGRDIAADEIAKLAEAGRQPALLTVLMAQFLSGMDRMPKKLRQSANARIASLIILRATLDELDRALRAG